MALRPGLGLAGIAIEDTLPMLEPVVISRADLDRGGGEVAFEAWFRYGDRDRLVGGLLLDLEKMPPSRSSTRPLTRPSDRTTADPVSLSDPRLVAYVSNCPHEACTVHLESNRQILTRAADGVGLPDGPVLLCPCHFSMFDPRKDGSRFAGPAYRGLYRYVLGVSGSSIIIDRLERAVVELFG